MYNPKHLYLWVSSPSQRRGDMMHFGETSKGRFGRKTIIISAVALVFAALSVYTLYDMNGQSFDLSNREVRLIITDSMDGEPTSYDVPTIPKDSLVMVKFLSDEDKTNLKQGDVIQFWDHGTLNHHRVILVGEGYVVTHGDNVAEGVDEVVKYSDIRGEVVGANHPIGEVFTFVKSYYPVLIALIAVLFIGSLLVEEIRRGKEES